MNSADSSQRCIIFTPVGRDASVAADLLREAGLPSIIVKNLDGLLVELERGAGLALIAGEFLQTSDLRPISTFLRDQPSWSDFPFVILTVRGGGPEKNPAAARVADILGNVTFLERPFHPTTFLSVIRTATRSRNRQYDARARQVDLAEGESRLQTALIAGNLGAWRLEVESQNLIASDKCKSHYGYAIDEPFNYDDLLRSVHPQDAGRMREAVAKSLNTGADYEIEYQNVWRDGSVHWVDVRARAIKNATGQVVQMVGVSSDITSRRFAEIERERLLEKLAVEQQALSQLTVELEDRVQERTSQLREEVANRERAQEQLLQSQKLESIGKLTGGIAHDFNNLLAAIVGNLDLLRKRVPDDPRIQRLVEGAMQGAQRGASLTQRMLAFARQQDLKTSAVDVTLLLVGLDDLIKRSLGARFELNVRTVGDLSPVQIDAVQVELAILNLAINARDAMPEGGLIEIEARQANSKKDGTAECVVISVTDSGSGMDPETLKKATEPFFSTKPLGKGTGLGLSMVHGLAVQLGGHLELMSEIGKGTKAELWLPIADGPIEFDQPLTEVLPDKKHATILVVDDDALIAMSTVEMLEDLGHTVFEARSAKQALEIIRATELDLLITDQVMPGMTGIELANVVKEMRPKLPVLLATGYTDLPAGLQSSIPRLSKPYRQAELKKQIDNLL